MDDFATELGESLLTSAGFFWKAGWAFVLGYAISAMIQVFIPRARLSRAMGEGGVKSIGIATGFGAISSSCSFAALAAARTLVLKGAHFIAAVAFMFASTNLVIELGILILIFLGPAYLAAEVAGGVILIAISSVLIRLTYPTSWFEAARERVEDEGGDMDDDFDPWERIKSLDGWLRVGTKFVGEWKMVWKEILFGFLVAGAVKVFVPDSFWETVFLVGDGGSSPGSAGIGQIVENALVAPFAAAMTFIGSMGNIPLATVLASTGITFAGLMAFIYSDLIVPPLVKVNARYYGWRVALYIAGIMYVAMVSTGLILHGAMAALDVIPEAPQAIASGEAFAIDYTFWFNVVFVVVAVALVVAHRRHVSGDEG